MCVTVLCLGPCSPGGGSVLQRVHPEESSEERCGGVCQDRGGGEQVGLTGSDTHTHNEAHTCVCVRLILLHCVQFVVIYLSL